MFTACNETDNYRETNRSMDISISSSIDSYMIKKIENVDSINIELDDSTREVYLLFTNTEKNSKKHNSNQNKKTYTQHASQHILDFNHQYIHKNNFKNNSIEKNSEKPLNLDHSRFYLEKDLSLSTQATRKKQLKNISTKYGNKTLNVWVSDDSFGEECSKSYCVTQEMVDALADRFLKKGEDNDIYDWVSNIFGEEWSDTSNSALIDNNNEITILITDIDNDNRTSGAVLGYFYAKDNYKKSLFQGSNEQIMFYIDSVLLAKHKDNEEWSIENYQTKKVLSTLAHEFSHMIHFYQKNILYKTDGLQPWIDEMLAVSIEDIIATKLQTTGLRGVSPNRGDAGEDDNSHGNFPLFNRNINLTLPIWNNQRRDYSKVSAFGSYLIRNYGGAKLLHDILHNKYTDESAIVEAVKQTPNGEDKDFDTLIQDWGIAILLSSTTELDPDSGYLYNLGDFLEDEYKNSTYSMGSINFFKYYTKPNVTTKAHNTMPKSNLYYKLDTKSTKNITIKIDQNPNIKTTLVIK